MTDEGATRSRPAELMEHAAEGLRTRRTELMEQAAAASRAGLRSRRERMIATARPILHTSVAAAIAWLVATEVFGHERAFFAPVAAVITLGLTVGQRRRRAVEIAVGVAVGIAIADALVSAIGTGTWQIAVVVGLAMTAATLIGGGPLLASQAAVSAVLVATLQPPEGGFDFNRSVDALIGSGTALLVGSLLLPIDPLRLVRDRTRPLLDHLAGTLEEIATALDARDAAASERALMAIGAVDPHYYALADALASAGDAARLSLRRRASLQRLEHYAAAAAELDLAVENVRSLARGATRAIDLDDATPPEVTASMRELAAAAGALGPVLDGEDPAASREPAVRAAGLANSVLEATSNLSAVHIVGQVRLIAVDLLPTSPSAAMRWSTTRRAGSVARAGRRRARHPPRTASPTGATSTWPTSAGRPETASSCSGAWSTSMSPIPRPSASPESPTAEARASSWHTSATGSGSRMAASLPGGAPPALRSRSAPPIHAGLGRTSWTRCSRTAAISTAASRARP